MIVIPARLEIAGDGRVTGNARIEYNDPFPCPNGTPGGGSPSMMGVVMHTMDASLSSCINTFNNPAAQRSAFFGVGLDGIIRQFGPVGQDWMAWAQVDGNPNWYSIEHADDEHPETPLTQAQIIASAQLVEVLSRFAGFPLEVSDSVNVKGYGTHAMGGIPWGDHPDCPGTVRAAQRPAIVELAKQIRNPQPAELEGILVRLPDGISRKVLSHDSGKTWA